MKAVQTIIMQLGSTSVITRTIPVNHHLYDQCFTTQIHDQPSDCSRPIVQRGKAARAKQTSVRETMTSLARRVVESVAILSG